MIIVSTLLSIGPLSQLSYWVAYINLTLKKLKQTKAMAHLEHSNSYVQRHFMFYVKSVKAF